MTYGMQCNYCKEFAATPSHFDMPRGWQYYSDGRVMHFCSRECLNNYLTEGCET